MKKISVIIPVYNCEKYLFEAIKSVINQTYSIFEIIVIDDGSTDGTAEVVKQFPEIRYFYQENRGTATALNVGLSKAREDFIAFLDADDLWSLDKLEKQVEYLNSHPETEIIFGHHKRFYTKSNQDLTYQEIEDMQRILPGYFKAALLAKREVFDKVGLFDESIKLGDFLDWYRRASDLNVKMDLLNEVVFYRRIHGENSSLRNKEHITDYLRIMKSSMDRRRNKI